MELMRILHVHSGNLYGGVETILMTLARRQDCPHLQHQFALCFQGRLSRELAGVGAPVHSIGSVRVSRPLTVFRARRELRKLLAAEEFDTLMFHSAWSHAIFAPVAQAARRRAVVWVHGTTGGSHWTERWARRSDPDLVVCNSRFTACGAAAVYPRTSRKVLYCPVELNSTPFSSSERKAIRAEFDTAENAVVIVQVSRMERWKGQLLHLAALKRLKSIPDWTCWFAGGPQRPEEEKYFSEIRHEAKRFGIAERVRFLNERSDVPRLLKAADIYCQPNLQPEPFGITLIEALNAALPVVATGMGGATEIVDDTCGMLVRPGNQEEIAGSLRRLIEEPRLRRRLGQGGPVRARELCDPATRIRELSGILTGMGSLSRHNP
jgi:glycosyltransferase involved in cell wall biosynthesis